MTILPLPLPGDEVQWVGAHLGHLVDGEVHASPAFRGGQQAADTALDAFDVTGYARRRNEVWPHERRGASRLSPYIRHSLITLRRAWEHVTGGPTDDVAKFRDELRWQEYARHVYARMGEATKQSLRFAVPEHGGPSGPDAWQGSMRCLDATWGELESTGWVTNQQRMWLASHWSVREGRGWRAGEELLFRHLLDGSRAANRLGWQWTVGAGTGKPYGFSRWQVSKRAPGMCERCELARACPIEAWPPDDAPAGLAADPRLRRDPDPSGAAGPARVHVTGRPDAVWLTAESLGDADPALAAQPGLPAVFVFDEPLLARLRLAPTRMVFIAETLADLATRRDLHVRLGDPVTELRGMAVATTHAPVPGWRRRAGAIDPVEVHPWPWLVPPHAGPITSFTAWSRSRST